jgi:hypothetical protein
MTKNKDLTIAEQLKSQLNTPKNQEVRYIETEDLYPDLGYEDVSTDKGYGPCFGSSCQCTSQCRCTKQQLREQIRILESKMSYAPDTASFRLSVGFRQDRL